jgi:hypothetical protein
VLAYKVWGPEVKPKHQDKKKKKKTHPLFTFGVFVIVSQQLHGDSQNLQERPGVLYYQAQGAPQVVSCCNEVQELIP